MTEKELKEIRINGNSNLTFYQQLVLNLSIHTSGQIPSTSASMIVEIADKVVEKMVVSLNKSS